VDDKIDAANRLTTRSSGYFVPTPIR